MVSWISVVIDSKSLPWIIKRPLQRNLRRHWFWIHTAAARRRLARSDWRPAASAPYAGMCVSLSGAVPVKLCQDQPRQVILTVESLFGSWVGRKEGGAWIETSRRLSFGAAAVLPGERATRRVAERLLEHDAQQRNSCAGRRAAGLVALGPPQGGNRHTAGQEAARRMWTPPHWQPRSLSRLRKVVTASPAGKRHATRARSAPLGKYFVWI
jgi:hypothetical protein